MREGPLVGWAKRSEPTKSRQYDEPCPSRWARRSALAHPTRQTMRRRATRRTSTGDGVLNRVRTMKRYRRAAMPDDMQDKPQTPRPFIVWRVPLFRLLAINLAVGWRWRRCWSAACSRSIRRTARPDLRRPLARHRRRAVAVWLRGDVWLGRDGHRDHGGGGMKADDETPRGPGRLVAQGGVSPVPFRDSSPEPLHLKVQPRHLIFTTSIIIECSARAPTPGLPRKGGRGSALPLPQAAQISKPGGGNRQMQKRRAFARRLVSMDCRVKPGNDDRN